MKKSNLIFIMGILVMLIGIVVLLQASDLNPLLAIESYCKWINTHYYSMEHPGRNIFLILFTYLIGGIIAAAGWEIIKKKEIKTS